MYSTIATLLDRLDRDCRPLRSVVPWAAPVPFFGRATEARVATVGINPSGREFASAAGVALAGGERRLPTLQALGLRSWRDADATTVRTIVAECSTYFARNPYDRWFRVLEQMLGESGESLYSPTSPVAHLDLIPYATIDKWGNLPIVERDTLLAVAGDALGSLLVDIPVTFLILNGRSVVRHFERLAVTRLAAQPMPHWALPRQRAAVAGMAYSGVIDCFGSIPLGRKLSVVGYNHNLQSSFGVTNCVIAAIGSWVATEMRRSSSYAIARVA